MTRLLTLNIFVLVFINVSLATLAPTQELNDGNRIPILAFGTGADTKEAISKMRQAVIWAIEAGYRHIETASVYGDEEEIGQAIADVIEKGIVKREDLFITNILWDDKHGRDQVVPALRESLKKLGLDYVDLCLIRFPISEKFNGSLDNIDYLETWKDMEEVKNLGLARSIGLSNFNSDQIDRIIANSKIKPAVNEIEVNPTLTQEPLISHCKNLGIVVMAYSPFGFIVSRSRPDSPPPRIDDPTLVKIAQKYGKTTIQVVLRYLIDRGLIPIPKSAKKDRIDQNIDLFDFQLTQDEISEINKFNKNMRSYIF